MDNVALLRTAFDALQSGDIDAAADFLVPDFIANLPSLPEPVLGREAWKLGAQEMLSAFPDLRIDIEDIFGAGDKVAVRLRFHGTHAGSFQGIPASQRQISFTSVEIYRIEGDRIAEEWVSPDVLGLMQQIAPTPEAADR